ncbi:hypothetical protein FGB62_53g16 [Gracilaria domingensis]|nr:hypothetical protein FGB62_53g16 [Gracilaria domingensis]
MLQRFIRIREELIAVHEKLRLLNMLAKMDAVTKSLQTRSHTLANCLKNLDVLMETVFQQRNKTRFSFYQCKLGKKYIAADANIVLQPAFEPGVVKIQNDMQSSLTDEGKEACDCLKKSSVSENGFKNKGNLFGSHIGMAQRQAKKRKFAKRSNEYMNCDFRLGSVADVRASPPVTLKRHTESNFRNF